MFANSNILRTLLSQLIQHGFHAAQQNLAFYVRRTLQRCLQHAFFFIQHSTDIADQLFVRGIRENMKQDFGSAFVFAEIPDPVQLAP